MVSLVGLAPLLRTLEILLIISNQKGAPIITAIMVNSKPIIFVSHPMGVVGFVAVVQPRGMELPRAALALLI